VSNKRVDNGKLVLQRDIGVVKQRVNEAYSVLYAEIHVIQQSIDKIQLALD
jgi:hypothetical protein